MINYNTVAKKYKIDFIDEIILSIYALPILLRKYL